MVSADLAKAIDQGEFEGVPFAVTGDGYALKPGDTYLAARNSGVNLLTCRENDKQKGWIVPVEWAYVFDTHECVRIEFKI